MMEGDDDSEITRAQAIARKVEAIEAALKEASQGRYEACWPLVSFGWKDADLDAEGCTGIKAIQAPREEVEGYTFRVEIGGHKYFTPASAGCERALSEEERASADATSHAYVMAVAQEAGATLYWDGDRWMARWEDVIEVPWPHWKTEPAEHVAARIITAAKEALKPFDQEMASGERMLNEQWRELDGKAPSNAEDYDA